MGGTIPINSCLTESKILAVYWNYTNKESSLRYATFNVLADAYIGYGDYSHADPELLAPGARLDYIVQQVNDLAVDVIGLQEADRNLLEAFEGDRRWQTLWLPKGHNKPDGCLTLVDKKIEIADYGSFTYDDESGHVFQVIQIGHLAVANTHIKWAPADDPRHIGVSQTRQLLGVLGKRQPAVILADCNDQPGGPVQTLVSEAGFRNLSADKPTANVNRKLVSLDLLSIRGVMGRSISLDYDLASIPNRICASDHIPVLADIDVQVS